MRQTSKHIVHCKHWEARSNFDGNESSSGCYPTVQCLPANLRKHAGILWVATAILFGLRLNEIPMLLLLDERYAYAPRGQLEVRNLAFLSILYCTSVDSLIGLRIH